MILWGCEVHVYMITKGQGKKPNKQTNIRRFREIFSETVNVKRCNVMRNASSFVHLVHVQDEFRVVLSCFLSYVLYRIVCILTAELTQSKVYCHITVDSEVKSWWLNCIVCKTAAYFCDEIRFEFVCNTIHDKVVNR